MRLIGISGMAGAGKDTAADHAVARHGYVKVALADEIKRIAMRLYGFTAEQLWGPSEERNKPDTRYSTPCYSCLQKGRVRTGGTLNVETGCVEGDDITEETCRYCNGACKIYLTPRRALQIIGTEIGRQCYENTWVDLMLQTAALLTKPAADMPGYAPALGVVWGKPLLAPSVPIGPYHTVRYVTMPGGVVVPDVRFKNEIAAIRAQDGYLVRVRRDVPELDGVAGLHVSETEQREIPDATFDVILNNTGTVLDLNRQMDQAIGAYRERVRLGIYQGLVKQKRAADPVLGAGEALRPTREGDQNIPPFRRRS